MQNAHKYTYTLSSMTAATIGNGDSLHGSVELDAQ
jgi:hypothetical protein